MAEQWVAGRVDDLVEAVEARRPVAVVNPPPTTAHRARVVTCTPSSPGARERATVELDDNRPIGLFLTDPGAARDRDAATNAAVAAAFRCLGRLARSGVLHRRDLGEISTFTPWGGLVPFESRREEICVAAPFVA